MIVTSYLKTKNGTNLHIGGPTTIVSSMSSEEEWKPPMKTLGDTYEL